MWLIPKDGEKPVDARKKVIQKVDEKLKIVCYHQFDTEV